MSEELIEKRLNFFLDCLKNMHQSAPVNIQMRISNELLSNLATSLLDDTIFEIVKNLVEIQNIIEKDLYQQRNQIENDNIDELQQWMAELNEEILNSLKIKHEEKLQEFDKRTIEVLDKEVEEQQRILEKAGVPGFFISDNPDEIRTQMYIIDFILRLSNIPFESN